MNELPLISVVIPTRNRPELLLRAIRSVFAQTYTKFEIIVVIDGHDADSIEALSSVRDPRLRYIEIANSGGGNQARNLGASMANADWIALLDDDDEWLPEKLRRQVSILAESGFNSQVVVACRFVAREPKGDAVWPRRLPAEKETVGDYMFDCRSLFDGEAALKTSTLMLSKKMMAETKFSTRVRKHQEIDFLLRASRNEKLQLRFAEEPLAIWNVDAARSAINNERNWRQSFDWIRSHRSKMRPKAYSGFLLVNLASESSGQGEWQAFVPILREAFIHGRPNAVQLVRYVCMWLLPPSVRQKVRLAVQRNRCAPQRVKAQNVPA
jgi:glycosyltransferase involved in cell wall biosynthesis